MRVLLCLVKIIFLSYASIPTILNNDNNSLDLEMTKIYKKSCMNPRPYEWNSTLKCRNKGFLPFTIQVKLAYIILSQSRPQIDKSCIISLIFSKVRFRIIECMPWLAEIGCKGNRDILEKRNTNIWVLSWINFNGLI